MNSILHIVILLISLAASRPAYAEVWPIRPIKLIVPLAAGSGVDILARFVAEGLSKKLGNPVFVENDPGASSILGTQIAAKAEPDGYTLLVATNTALATNMFLFKSLPYDPQRDFTPVAMVAESGFMISVNPTLPIHTLPQLIAYAKANPDKLSYAVDVSSSFAPTIGRALEVRAGIQMHMVPYRSVTQAIQDTIAGSTDLLIGSIAPAEPFFKEGLLRRVAQPTSRRFAGAETIPTVAETLPDFRFDAYITIATRAGTPDGIVSRLNREMDSIMKEPEIVSRLKKLGFSASAAGTPQSVNAVIQADRSFWKQLTMELKLEPQ